MGHGPNLSACLGVTRESSLRLVVRQGGPSSAERSKEHLQIQDIGKYSRSVAILSVTGRIFSSCHGVIMETINSFHTLQDNNNDFNPFSYEHNLVPIRIKVGKKTWMFITHV